MSRLRFCRVSTTRALRKRPLDCSWATKVLGARAETDKTGGQLPQERKPFQQTNDQRQRVPSAGLSAGDSPMMDEDLNALDQTRRPFTSCLYFSQIVYSGRTASQFFCE